MHAPRTGKGNTDTLHEIGNRVRRDLRSRTLGRRSRSPRISSAIPLRPICRPHAMRMARRARVGVVHGEPAQRREQRLPVLFDQRRRVCHHDRHYSRSVPANRELERVHVLHPDPPPTPPPYTLVAVAFPAQNGVPVGTSTRIDVICDAGGAATITSTDGVAAPVPVVDRGFLALLADVRMLFGAADAGAKDARGLIVLQRRRVSACASTTRARCVNAARARRLHRCRLFRSTVTPFPR